MAHIRLGVDFGTSHTVAVLSRPDGRTEPLLFDGSPLLPSGVFLGADGAPITGRYAERSARSDPGRYEPNPKRRIDDMTVLLGESEVPVPALIGYVLGRVAAEARRVAGADPAEVTLTHPAEWGPQRRGALTEAARLAGLGPVRLVPEPIAAARYFTTVLGHRVATGTTVVVYDFGGGTFDIAVVGRDRDGWRVVANDGLPDVGGVDLDLVVVDTVGATLGRRDPARWERLTHPRDAADRRAHLMLFADARNAKEQLSGSTTSTLFVPLFDTDAHVTREQFEQQAHGWLERTVSLTASTLYRARLAPEHVAGIFLVGGSSRIPLAATLLHRRLGIAPTVIEQPEIVVAAGSLLDPPPVAATPPGPPASPLTAAPPAGPAGLAAAGTPYLGGLPGTAGAPGGAQAVPPAAASGSVPPGRPGTASFAATAPTGTSPAMGGAPPQSAAPSGGQTPGTTPARGRRRRRALLAIAAAVLVVALGGGLGWYFLGRDDPLAGVSLTAKGRRNADQFNDDDLKALAAPWLNDTNCKKGSIQGYEKEKVSCDQGSQSTDDWTVEFVLYASDSSRDGQRSKVTGAAKQQHQTTKKFTASTPKSGRLACWTTESGANTNEKHLYWDDDGSRATATLSMFTGAFTDLTGVWKQHTAGRL